MSALRERNKDKLEAAQARLAPLRTPSALRKSATVFGVMALFGIGDFVGAAVRGTLTAGIVLRFVAALCFAVAAALFWRDSRRPVPDEKP